MREHLFVRRRFSLLSLHLSLERAVGNELVSLGLFPGAIDLQVTQDQRPPSALFQENKGVGCEESRRVKHVGVLFARRHHQSHHLILFPSAAHQTVLSANRRLVMRPDQRIVLPNRIASAPRTVVSNMTSTSLIIVTDRGSFKAYRVNETPPRGPTLHRVQAFETTDAHAKFLDRHTDQAGAFPNAAGPGQMNSTAERMGIDNETDRR